MEDAIDNRRARQAAIPGGAGERARTGRAAAPSLLAGAAR
jgi:hypothetical protein